MIDSAWFTRLILKRDATVVAPLIDVLAPAEGGTAMATTHRLLWTVMTPEIQSRFDRNRSDRPSGGAFLWREAEPGGKYYLLGPKPTDQSPFFDVACKPFDPCFAVGDRLAFDLRVNATVDRKVGVGADGKAIRKRLDIAMDRILMDEKRDDISSLAPRAVRRAPTAQTAASEWLGAIGERDGFRVSAMGLDAYRVETLPRKGPPARIGVCDLTGVIEVLEPSALIRRVLSGFGRSRAFGCGLMLLRRA